jgi:pyroglutamyl-peptidase
MKRKMNHFIKYSICIITISIILLNTNISAINTNKNQTDKIVLITGFGPFDNHDVNPSELIIESLNGSYMSDYQVIGIVLTVDFEDAVKEIKQAISKYNPDLIISFGLAPSATKIRVETIGINIRYNPNTQNPLLSIKRVNKSGPFFTFSNIKIKDTVDAINNENIPCVQSYHAGLYVCNALFYDTLFYLYNKNLEIPMDFIHVPKLKSDNPEGMEFEKMIQAAEIIINTNIADLNL